MELNYITGKRSKMVKIIVTLHTDKVIKQKTFYDIEEAKKIAKEWTLKYGHCVSMDTHPN